MITVVFDKNKIIWIFSNASKQDPVLAIRFILTTLKIEQQPCRRVRIYEDGALENSTDVTNLLVDNLNIYLLNIGGGSSWINGKNEIHNINIHNMVISGLLEINQHSKKL